MICKNCKHKVVKHGGEWKHWRDDIHDENSPRFNWEMYCNCDKPKPREKTIGDYNDKRTD